jgi:predicted DCC family thiol-disulfide oxidoreductase YuxK
MNGRSQVPPTFEVFYDEECPLCRREIELLRRLDRNRRVVFTSLSSSAFDASVVGKSRAELMARIHGRDLRNGEIVEGVEVFRRLYSAVGFGGFVALSRLPLLSWTLDRAYDWFAENRLRLTGRSTCTDETCGISAH